MKVYAELNGQKHEIEIKRDGERVHASVDGRVYELEFTEPVKRAYLLKHDDRVFDVAVVLPLKPGEPHGTSLRGNAFEITLTDPRRLRSVAADHAQADGEVDIKTAMPGKVVRIVAAAGTAVAKGDGIIVVEAMKMQNEIKSPKDGRVKSIRAAEGATVNAGDILAVIE